MKYSVVVEYKEPGASGRTSQTFTVEANSDAQAKMEAIDKLDSRYRDKVVETRIVAKF